MYVGKRIGSQTVLALASTTPLTRWGKRNGTMVSSVHALSKTCQARGDPKVGKVNYTFAFKYLLVCVCCLVYV